MMLRVGCRWCGDALAPDCNVLDMIGRLADGRTVEQAQAEVSALGTSMWAIAPEDGNSGAIVLRATGITHPDVSRNASLRFVRLLIWFSGLLLLICCANLAGLLTARNSARGRELAIRASLGAGRMRLLRQLLTESFLLSILGGALGVVCSLALTRALKMMFYSSDIDGRPLNYDFALSLPVLIGSIIVSAAAGLCFGVVPALSTLPKLESPSVIRSLRLGGWLVGAQAALAVALITIAGLLSASARARIAVRNVETSRIALLRLRPRLIQYPIDRAHWFQRTVIKRLEMLSMVESVSIVGNGAVLLGHGAQLSLPRWTSSRQGACVEIGPRYFETLRTPLLGREFDERDSVEAVAVVNETLAHTFWPGETVIGAILNVNGRPHRVVGIAGDIPLEERGVPPESYVYTPYWQNPGLIDSTVCVRVNGDPAAIMSSLVAEANRVDVDLPVAETTTLPRQIAASIQSLRITASLVSYAAILAILLTAVGLYSSIAFSVSRRKREMAVRIALGAAPGRVGAMVIRQGMFIAFTGVIAGLGGAAVGASLVRHLLYGTGAGDGVWYLAAASAVLIISFLACLIPALRATSIEPAIALRDQ
jgi:predicted permease